jgi:hypothetical protein
MPEATLQLGNLHGVWRTVYAHRQALHTTADQLVIAAWRRDIHGLDLDTALAWWTTTPQETADPDRQHRREAASAAVLTALTGWSWLRGLAALRQAIRQAHRTGWRTGRHLTTTGQDDDTPLVDDGGGDTVPDAADLTDAAVDNAAATALTAALRATARRAGRHMADADDPAAAEQTIADGYDLKQAADVAVSAAYGAGVLAAYLATGATSVSWVTAGDGHVCSACTTAEAGSPYSLLAAPRLPQHPNCRCVLTT